MSLITLERVSMAYTVEDVATQALREVSVTIEQGEYVAIMGPSGSGKSTLLHILGLLDRPSSGTYFFEEHNAISYSDNELAYIRNQKMGFVFQAFHLLSRTSVVDNVLLPLQYSSAPLASRRQQALQAIEHVGLSHRIHHIPSQLSGGEKQRVAIARALVNNPLVIFADEPTGNLDSRSGQIVLELLEQLHSQGHTVILITHESPTAAYAQRIITMRDGQIVTDQANQPTGHHHYQK